MLPVTPVTGETPAFDPPPPGLFAELGHQGDEEGRDSPSPARPGALASGSRHGSSLLGPRHRDRCWGDDLGRLAVGYRVGTAPFAWGAGFGSPPGCAQKPLLGEASIAAAVAAGGGAGTPGRQVEAAPQLGGRERGAGQRRRRRVAPSRQQPAAAGPRSPRRGRSPAPSAPTQEGARREGGPRAPCSARVHLRTWNARPRVPGSPSPGLPASGPSLEKHPGREGEAGAYPERGGSAAGAALRAGPVGKGRLRCAARAPAPAERPAPRLQLRLPLPRAWPRRSAAPRPAPLSAELRIPPSRLPSALGRGRWGGGAGERRRKMKHLDLSLDRCQRAQSNYSPWSGGRRGN